MEDKRKQTNEVLGGLFGNSSLFSGLPTAVDASAIDKTPNATTMDSSPIAGEETPNNYNINVNVTQNLIQKEVEKAVNGILNSTSDAKQIKKNYTLESPQENIKSNLIESLNANGDSFQNVNLTQSSSNSEPNQNVSITSDTINNNTYTNAFGGNRNSLFTSTVNDYNLSTQSRIGINPNGSDYTSTNSPSGSSPSTGPMNFDISKYPNLNQPQPPAINPTIEYYNSNDSNVEFSPPAPTVSSSLQSQNSQVFHFNSGGLVPGTGTKDSVPAILTPGEFVLTKEATQKIGVDKLTSMNSGFNFSQYPNLTDRQKEIITQHPNLFFNAGLGNEESSTPDEDFRTYAADLKDASKDKKANIPLLRRHLDDYLTSEKFNPAAGRGLYGASINSNTTVKNDQITRDHIESTSPLFIASNEAKALAEFYGYPDYFDREASSIEPGKKITDSPFIHFRGDTVSEGDSLTMNSTHNSNWWKGVPALPESFELKPFAMDMRNPESKLGHSMELKYAKDERGKIVKSSKDEVFQSRTEQINKETNELIEKNTKSQSKSESILNNNSNSNTTNFANVAPGTPAQMIAQLAFANVNNDPSNNTNQSEFVNNYLSGDAGTQTSTLNNNTNVSIAGVEHNASHVGLNVAGNINNTETNNETNIQTANNVNSSSNSQSSHNHTQNNSNTANIRTNGSPDVDSHGKALSINKDGSFNISRNTPGIVNTTNTTNVNTEVHKHHYVNPNSPEGRIAGMDKPQFSVGRSSTGTPIITGGSYINPNSPEGRLIADDTINPDGSMKDTDKFGPKTIDAAKRLVKEDTVKIEGELRAEDIRQNGPMPISNNQTNTTNQSGFVNNYLTEDHTTHATTLNTNTDISVTGVETNTSNLALNNSNVANSETHNQTNNQSTTNTNHSSNQHTANNSTHISSNNTNIRTSGSADLDSSGKPLSINKDGSFNIPGKTPGTSISSNTTNVNTEVHNHHYVNPNSPEGRIAGMDKPQFSVGRSSTGTPIITGGSYINPNSPQGRLIADDTINRDGSMKDTDKFGPKTLDAAKRLVHEDTVKIEGELRAADIRQNGPMPISNNQTNTTNQSQFVDNFLGGDTTSHTSHVSNNTNMSVSGVENTASHTSLSVAGDVSNSQTNSESNTQSATHVNSSSNLQSSNTNTQISSNNTNIRTSGSADLDSSGKPLSINKDGSFNIPGKTPGMTNVSNATNINTEVHNHHYVNPNSPEGRIAGMDKPEFTVGRSSTGTPIITGGSYINPNSPQGRLIADDTINPDGSMKDTDKFGPKTIDAARRLVKEDTKRVESELRAADIKQNGPMPSSIVENKNANQSSFVNNYLNDTKTQNATSTNTNTNISINGVESAASNIALNANNNSDNSQSYNENSNQSTTEVHNHHYVNPNSPEGRILGVKQPQSGFHYINPNSPEGRLIADDTINPDGSMKDTDKFGPKTIDAAKRLAHEDTVKIQSQLRAEDIRQNGPMPINNDQTNITNQSNTTINAILGHQATTHAILSSYNENIGIDNSQSNQFNNINEFNPTSFNNDLQQNQFDMNQSSLNNTDRSSYFNNNINSNQSYIAGDINNTSNRFSNNNSNTINNLFKTDYSSMISNISRSSLASDTKENLKVIIREIISEEREEHQQEEENASGMDMIDMLQDQNDTVEFMDNQSEMTDNIVNSIVGDYSSITDIMQKISSPPDWRTTLG